MSLNLYKELQGVFVTSTDKIQESIYDSANMIFDNTFFEVALGIGIMWIGGLIAFRKISNEETAYKFIWMILMFSIVKVMLTDLKYYIYFIEIINIPRDAFLSTVYDIVRTIDKDADIGNIITSLQTSLDHIANTIFSKGSWDTWIPYVYGFIILFTGTFLIIVISLTAVFSVFLTNIILALLPLILPTLIWKKTEYVFFGWLKLYISVSLYAPFTMLFGLVAIEVVKLTMKINKLIGDDFQANMELIVILIVAQFLVAIAIFKIPNIVNQLIGSSNEGSSLTSGVGTVSAGVAVMSSVAKYTGLRFATKQGGKALSKGAGMAYDKAKDTIKEKIQMR